MSRQSHRWGRRTVFAAVVAMTALVVTGLAQTAGQATHDLITLSGTTGEDDFLVTPDPADVARLMFCDGATCFTRAKSEVGSVIVEGFAGDDTLTVHHTSLLATNSLGDLTITFDAGPGADEARVCGGTGLAACTAVVSTAVGTSVTPDERVLTQTDSSSRTTTLTLRGVVAARDVSPGTLSVHGTTAGDVIAYGPTVESGFGEVVVGSLAPYRFDRKSSVVIDGASGPDHVLLAASSGLGTPVTSCASGPTSARVCVRGDAAEDDRVDVGPDAATETLVLTARDTGDATLTGSGAVGTIDLVGIDHLVATVEPSDRLQVAGTASGDVLRISDDATGVLLTGDLAVDGVAHPLPTVELHGDGSGPLAVTFVGAAGTDVVEVTTSAGDDAVAVGPSNGTCTTMPSTCIEVSSDGQPGYDLTLTDVEDHLLVAGDGDDELSIVSSLLATTTWRGGAGADSLGVIGSGANVTAALADGTVLEGAAGLITATGAEEWAIDAAGASLLTTTGAAADDITFRATGPDSGTVMAVGQPSLTATGVGGSNRIDPAAGDDVVTVLGTTGADAVAVGRVGPDVAVQVGSSLPVTVLGAEEAVVAADAGNDEVSVNGTGGPATLTVDGGTDAGADVVDMAIATTDVVVSVDDDLGTGQVTTVGPPLGLRGIERVEVEGDGTDKLTVEGSDAVDTMTQEGNTITVGRTTDVLFAAFPDVAIDGGAADDDLWVSPASSVGVSSFVARGSGGADTLTVLGTALSEHIVHRPSGADAGTVAVGSAPEVAFMGVAATHVDGRTSPPSGDTLVVDTPFHHGTMTVEPGLTFDSGVVRFRDAVGASTITSPLHFGGMGIGEVRFDGDAASAADRVVVAGQDDDDLFVVTTHGAAPSEAVVRMDGQIPVELPGAHTLVLDGRDGDDTFRVPTDHVLGGAGGPGIDVVAGGPSTGDTLELSAGPGALVVDTGGSTIQEVGSAPVAHSGISMLLLDASTSPLRVLGGDGPDVMTWVPAGAEAGDVVVGGAPVLRASAVGDLTVDPGSGTDTVVVALRSVADDVTVARGATTEVAVAGLQSVLLPASVESLRVDAASGPDVITVVGAGGPGDLTVEAAGPTGVGDVLRVIASDVEIVHSSDPAAGVVTTAGGVVGFTGVETLDLVGDGNGGVVLNGTNTSDAIVVGGSDGPGVTIGGTHVDHSGFSELVIDAGGGDDDVIIGYANLELSSLLVIGGPGTGDRVTVIDTEGTTRSSTYTPTDADDGHLVAAGHPTTISVEGVEWIAVDGRGGDDHVDVVSPVGSQDVVVTPLGADGGKFAVASLLALDVRQLGVDGSLQLLDAEALRTDSLSLVGSTSSDSIDVVASTGEVHLAGWLALMPAGALDLTLLGHDGDDAVSLTGPLPYRTTTFDGGGPDLGDALSMQGPSSDVVVDLAAASVVGYGGAVRFPGVVDLHTDVGGLGLTQIGTDRDDAVCFDPMAPRDGRLYIVGAPGGGTSSSICVPDVRGTNVLHTFVDVGRLDVDPGAGSDELIVNGTTSRDLVAVHMQSPFTQVTVHPEPESGSTARLSVHALVSSTESVVVASDNGSDSIDVTMYEGPTSLLTVFGEGPATRHGGDDLTVRDGTGAARMRHTKSATKGSGSVEAEYFKASGVVVRMDYADIENVSIVKDPKAGQ